MGRKKSAPKEFRELVKEQDKDGAKNALARLRSKKIWYTLALLAIGGVTWKVIQWYARSFDMYGIGEATIAHLRDLGRALHFPKSTFTTARYDALARARDGYIQKVKNRQLTSIEALRQFTKLFRKSDPLEVRIAFIKDIGIKVREKWSLPMIEYWVPMVREALTGKSNVSRLRPSS